MKDAADKVTGILFTLTNVTTRKLAEDALKESEDKFRSLYESMSEGVALHEIIYDSSGKAVDYRILECNPAYSEHTGIPRLSALEALGSVLYGTGDVPCLDTYAAVAETGEPARFEIFFSSLSRYFRISAFSPAKGQCATVFEDVTAERKIEESMRNAQRLESLGVLAGGIAHDFNNLLVGLFSYIDLAKALAPAQSPLADYLAKAMGVYDRAKDLTQQLLTFARGGAPVKEITEVGALLRKAAEFVLSGSNVAALVETAEDLWLCELDRGQIAQVIDNLVLNARQAMPTGGLVRIVAGNVAVDAAAPGVSTVVRRR